MVTTVGHLPLRSTYAAHRPESAFIKSSARLTRKLLGEQLVDVAKCHGSSNPSSEAVEIGALQDAFALSCAWFLPTRLKNRQHIASFAFGPAFRLAFDPSTIYEMLMSPAGHLTLARERLGTGVRGNGFAVELRLIDFGQVAGRLVSPEVLTFTPSGKAVVSPT